MSQRSSVRACALAVAVAAGGLPSCRAITTSLLNLSPQKTAAEAQARQFQASLEWQEVTPDKDVYMSISMELGYGSPCNSGYMGAQFRSGGYNTLLWSMSGHEDGQIVPVSEYCHYDCSDCSPPNVRDFQCKRDDYELKTGVVYTFAMQMEMQNSTGAMWSVTMMDPTDADPTAAGDPVEIGRVFFKDSESLENCRTLGLDVFAFQEFFNHNDLDFTTKAAWSATTLSGVMQPEDTKGYCNESTISYFEELSLLECKNKCAADETCRFASYSAENFVGGKPTCLLFDTCGKKSTDLADMWWTYAKQEEYPSVTLTGFDSCSGSATCCVQYQQYQNETGANTITEFAAVVSSATGEAEFEFQAGPDVQCPSAASLLEAAPLSEPASPALRGSAGDAHGAPPQGGAPAPGEPVLFP